MISLIAAINQARTIGHQGQIPWKIPSDLRHFKKITNHTNVIMGRKTHESIGRTLDDRISYVISPTEVKRVQAQFSEPVIVGGGLDSLRWRSSLMECLWEARFDQWRWDISIIGGAQIYKEALDLHEEWGKRWSMNLIDKMVISDVDDGFEGDTKFAAIDPKAWAIISEGPWIQESGDQHRYRILEFEPAAK